MQCITTSGGWRTRTAWVLAVLSSLAAASTVRGGGGQANIEQGLPLQFEDTVPQEFLGREFQLVSRYERTDDSKDRWLRQGPIDYRVQTPCVFAIAGVFPQAGESWKPSRRASYAKWPSSCGGLPLLFGGRPWCNAAHGRCL